MDAQIAALLAEFLPQELIAEIEDFLMAAYRREIARVIFEMIRRHTEFMENSFYLDARCDNEKDHISFGNHCEICGDPENALIYSWLTHDIIFERFPDKYCCKIYH